MSQDDPKTCIDSFQVSKKDYMSNRELFPTRPWYSSEIKIFVYKCGRYADTLIETHSIRPPIFEYPAQERGVLSMPGMLHGGRNGVNQIPDA